MLTTIDTARSLDLDAESRRNSRAPPTDATAPAPPAAARLPAGRGHAADRGAIARRGSILPDFDPRRGLLVGVLPHPFCNPAVAGCGFCTFPHEAFTSRKAAVVIDHVVREIEQTLQRGPASPGGRSPACTSAAARPTSARRSRSASCAARWPRPSTSRPPR